MMNGHTLANLKSPYDLVILLEFRFGELGEAETCTKLEIADSILPPYLQRLLKESAEENRLTDGDFRALYERNINDLASGRSEPQKF